MRTSDPSITGGLRCGAVHELLCPAPFPPPRALALFLAGQRREGAIACSDPGGDPGGLLYPPAVAAAGIDLGRVIILRCARRVDEMWALIECLRCPGVAATVAWVPQLSQLEARRLQLAAERGGGVGIFLRPWTPRAHYAAATRWLVRPAPGADRQRWTVQLVHSHAERVGEFFFWEMDRETGAVRASSPLAHGPVAPAAARATA